MVRFGLSAGCCACAGCVLLAGAACVFLAGRGVGSCFLAGSGCCFLAGLGSRFLAGVSVFLAGGVGVYEGDVGENGALNGLSSGGFNCRRRRVGLAGVGLASLIAFKARIRRIGLFDPLRPVRMDVGG